LTRTRETGRVRRMRKTSGMNRSWEEWAARDARERAELDAPPNRPVRLKPASMFSHRKADPEVAAVLTEGKTMAVERRFSQSCAGWTRQPTRNELLEAIRAGTHTDRQRAILRTWANEGEWWEHQQAFCERAYTLRELVEGLHRAGISTCRAARWLNRQTG